MKCVKCGNELEQGARFCGACGTQQPGAVIPQAAVRTGAKTLFQGSAPIIPRPAAAAPAPQAQAVPQARSAPPPVANVPRPVASSGSGPAVPDKSGPRSAEMGFAATIAPGSAEMRAVAPQPVPSTSQPRPATPPLSQLAPPAIDHDLTGKLLNNRYLIEAKIGEGGFGSVYRALQTQMQRKVALKVLHAKMARDPQVVGRFKREAQASSLLRAPHTVQVYDFDQSPEGVMYLAMEMLQGRSLHAILTEEGPLPSPRLFRVMDGIADSLGEAHAQGIVHRDIKPENIYLEQRPEPDFVKVLDFGIAKIVSGEGLSAGGPALTAAGQTLGTLEYMSPEQLMGAQLDGRSDLYALGILGYELVTGSLPFHAKTPGEMITAHLKTMPPPPSQRAPDRNIPPLLDAVILKLLAKKRDDRYRDTAELRGDLGRLMRGETVPRVSAPQPSAAPAPAQPLGATGYAPAPVAQTPVVAPAAPLRAEPLAASRPATSTDRMAQASGGNQKLLILGAVIVVAAVLGIVALLLFRH